MIKNIKEHILNKEYIILVILLVSFVLIRLPGTSLPLHQDEYKWPLIVNPALESDTEIPHPPLSQFIFRLGGEIVGFNTNFRFIPLFFGTINLLLLYYLVRYLFGKDEAIIASLIWILSFFSILASLMVDTDGEIMPFFFLISLISYFKLRNSEGNKKYLWGFILLVSSIMGFFIKVSFLLAIAAILSDFLWSKKHLLSKKDIFKYIIKILIGCLLLVSLLFISQKLFPFFNLKTSLQYWEHFWATDRGWFQTAIQCIKALFYTSPFLVLVPFLSSKNSLNKVRVFVFFLFYSLIFYLILFDFSIGALDRYLQFMILPLTIITTSVVSRVFQSNTGEFKKFFYLGSIIALILVLLQSIPHYVPPLHPKSEWINRVLSLKWNFLYPFTGGSGPLGFYVSFMFIALSWGITFFATLFAIFKRDYKKMILVFLIPLGIVYNLTFTGEYLLGFRNGSSSKLLKDVVGFIKDNQDIKMVTIYNDNGGNEIQEIGKYRKRLYVDPKFDINEKIKTLNQYKEHYLVIDIPKIDPNSIYKKYFDTCNVIYDKNDKYISAIVYDCKNAPDIKI